MQLRLLQISVALTAMAVVGCSDAAAKVKEKEAPKEKLVSVKTIKLIPNKFEEHLTYYGKTKASQEATLISYEAGRVNRLRVKEGDRIKKGQALCNIDAEIHSARVEAGKLALKIAKDQSEAANAHLEKGSGSQISADQAKMNELKVKQNLLSFKKVQRGALCIAPFSGRVAKIYVDEFQNLTPGSRTITLVNEEKIKVRFGVPESRISFFEKGKVLEIKNTFNSKKSIHTKVKAISSIIDPKERTFMAEAWVQNKNGNFKGGQTAQVHSVGLFKENSLVIPSNVILPRSGKAEVMVAVNGKVESRDIKVISSNEKFSLVEGDLEFGESLIIEGQSKVIPGSLVKVVSIEEAN